MKGKDIKYESPIIKVILISVEKGFTSSNKGDGGISAPDWGII